jgi:hypothetical protein
MCGTVGLAPSRSLLPANLTGSCREPSVIFCTRHAANTTHRRSLSQRLTERLTLPLTLQAANVCPGAPYACSARSPDHGAMNVCSRACGRLKPSGSSAKAHSMAAGHSRRVTKPMSFNFPSLVRSQSRRVRHSVRLAIIRWPWLPHQPPPLRFVK